MGVKISAQERLKKLRAQKKNRTTMAETLRNEGYSFEEVLEAFMAERIFVRRSVIRQEVPVINFTRRGTPPKKGYYPVEWTPPTRYIYSRRDPHWIEASRVEQLGSGNVNVWVDDTLYRNCKVEWTNPFADKSKSDTLVEDPTMGGFLRVWWYDKDVVIPS